MAQISYAFFQRSRPVPWRSVPGALQHDVFYYLIGDHRRCTVELLGDASSGCAWAVDTSLLNANSIVVSAGAGKDVSFELSLADRFGCRIILLDPSETGKETMALRQNQRPNISFVTKALAGQDGVIRLTPPTDEAEGSWHLSHDSKSGTEVESISLPSLMMEFELPRIDFLKMDIEGSEYEVASALCANGPKIGQICVEYHNKVLPGYTRGATVRSLLALWRAGYRLIHKNGSNHTLVSKYH
jgi:FkbM family methyltransferase